MIREEERLNDFYYDKIVSDVLERYEYEISDSMD